MNLDTLNTIDKAQAYQIFEACCCAPNWVEEMVACSPFPRSTNVTSTSYKNLAKFKRARLSGGFFRPSTNW